MALEVRYHWVERLDIGENVLQKPVLLRAVRLRALRSVRDGIGVKLRIRAVYVIEIGDEDLVQGAHFFNRFLRRGALFQRCAVPIPRLGGRKFFQRRHAAVFQLAAEARALVHFEKQRVFVVGVLPRFKSVGVRHVERDEQIAVSVFDFALVIRGEVGLRHRHVRSLRRAPRKHRCAAQQGQCRNRQFLPKALHNMPPLSSLSFRLYFITFSA